MSFVGAAPRLDLFFGRETAMRRDVHQKALKAASNVAFSVALFGCGAVAPDATSSSPSSAADGTPATSQAESDLTKKHGHAAAGAGCHDAGASAPDAAPVDCAALLDATLPSPDRYPGMKQAVSAEVATCCDAFLADWEAELAKGAVPADGHRWSCCANQTDPKQNGAACTPWGPPVPPPMRLEVA
jgi:hypothetical protein